MDQMLLMGALGGMLVILLIKDRLQRGDWSRWPALALLPISLFVPWRLAAEAEWVTLAIVAFLVIGLERLWPRKKDSLASAEKVRGTMYLLVGTAADFLWALTPMGVYLAYLTENPTSHGLEPLGVPMPLQALIFFVLHDLKNYVLHRLDHAVPFLWRFHKIHHATTEVSVLAATVRDHPSYVLTQGITGSLLGYALGISVDAFGLVMMVILLFTVTNHLDLNLPRFEKGMPWWAYLFSTPNYHGWHHTVHCRSNANLADMLPLWDVLFGTFERPTLSGKEWEFGLKPEERLPDSVSSQLWFPVGAAWKRQPSPGPETLPAVAPERDAA